MISRTSCCPWCPTTSTTGPPLSKSGATPGSEGSSPVRRRSSGKCRSLRRNSSSRRFNGKAPTSSTRRRPRQNWTSLIPSRSMPCTAIRLITPMPYSVSNEFLTVCLEGVVKMSSHLCYEFSKSIVKCDCRRRKRSLMYYKDSKKPIWMHSGFNFAHRKSYQAAL